MIDHGLSKSQLHIIKNILSLYSNKIDFVGLFGSRAVGNYKANSDIDIVIYGSIEEKIANRIYTLFKNSNLPFKVDLQAYDLIEYLPLKNHIDQNMVLLFDHSSLIKK